MRADLRVLCSVAIVVLIVVACAGAVGAADWSEVILDHGILPLENRIAVLGPENSDPDLLVFTLWNTGVNQNHLGAFFVPPPYDGSNVTFTQDIDLGILYGVGQICVIAENRVVVPDIKWSGGNYDVYAAEYNGATWSTTVIPGTATDDFHTCDCFVTEDGVFLMALNATDDTWDFYQRPLATEGQGTLDGSGPWGPSDNPGGVFIYIDSMDGGVGMDPQDPWDGGGIATTATGYSVFAPLEAPGPFDPDVVAAFPRQPKGGNPNQGEILIGSFDTNPFGGSFQGVVGPNGSFEISIVRHTSDVPPQIDGVWLGHQRNNRLFATHMEIGNPGSLHTLDLGPIVPGNLLNFQGIGTAARPDGTALITADRAYGITPDHVVEIQNTAFPFEGTGGPSQSLFFSGKTNRDSAFVAGPGSQVLGILSVPFFEDGFESGDTSGWSGTNP